MTTLNDSLGMEKILIQAGAATVGRPSGTNGKKMFPRRSKMTTKEVESLKTKALKAGGPGSGRKSSMGMTKSAHESAQRQAEYSAHHSIGSEKSKWQQKAEMHQRFINQLSKPEPPSPEDEIERSRR